MKRTWISWTLPVIGAALVIWYYTGTMPWTHSAHKGREGYVWISCEPYELASGKGWGYNIREEGKTLIHQDRIPSVPGIKPFVSKEDAMKVGQLMIDKLKKGLFPPAVTYQEMQGLGVDMN
jgi:hypothetical protein